MQYEIFSQEGKQKVKFYGTFAASKNYNKAYFDVVEVFAVQPPEIFNLNHKDRDTDYSTGTKIKTSGYRIDDKSKLLQFNWAGESENENFVALAKAGKLKGFSPELRRLSDPITTPNGERFYKEKQLVWESTAILDNETPSGFVGADNAEFEAFSKDLGYEFFALEVVDEAADTQEETKKDEEKTEEFRSWVSINQFARYDDKVGIVTTITQRENGQTITMQLQDGSSISITESEDDRKLESVSFAEIIKPMWMNVKTETFSSDKDDEELTEEQKKAEEQAETFANLNAHVKKMETFSDVRKAEKGASDELKTASKATYEAHKIINKAIR